MGLLLPRQDPENDRHSQSSTRGNRQPQTKRASGRTAKFEAGTPGFSPTKINLPVRSLRGLLLVGLSKQSHPSANEIASGAGLWKNTRNDAITPRLSSSIVGRRPTVSSYKNKNSEVRIQHILCVPASNFALPTEAVIVWGCFFRVRTRKRTDPRNAAHGASDSPKRSVPPGEQHSLRLAHSTLAFQFRPRASPTR